MIREKTTAPSSALIWVILMVIALSMLVLQIGVLVVSSESGTDIMSPREKPRNIIILVGLPHSGSLAVHEYLKCHGMSAMHYCCDGSPKTEFPCQTCGSCVLKNLQARRPAFEKCSGRTVANVWSRFDMETAETWFLPQHFALGLLHESYPNATWILQTRGSSREWAESIYHWHSVTRRIFDAFSLPMNPSHAISQAPDPKTRVSKEEIELDMEQQLQARVYNTTEHLRKLLLLERMYENHTASIYRWANQFNTHSLIHINVDDAKSTTERLDRALGEHLDLSRGRGRCEWSYRSQTDDWKDFSFPFLP